MKNHLLGFCLLALLFSCTPPDTPVSAESQEGQSTPLTIGNDQLEVTIDAYGGAFERVALKEQPVNPFTWALTAEQMPDNNKAGAAFKGHFLCLGRWGQPSRGEMKAGLPHNGEPANSMWAIEEQDEKHLRMTAGAPLDGMAVDRTVDVHPDAPVFSVTERFTNTFSLSRPTNVVQQITVGPPFLSPALTVNTNASHGFNQKFAMPNPEKLAYEWPMGVADTTGRKIDMSKSDENENYVTTHLFPDSATYGWVTALQPEEGLLLGYIWKLEAYPWINIWNHYSDGKPAAKGLEFGTTGIGAPYEALIMKDTRFKGQQSFEYIDAGETLEKSFAGFLIPAKGVQSVKKLDVSDSGVIIKMEDNTGLPITITLPNPL